MFNRTLVCCTLLLTLRSVWGAEPLVVQSKLAFTNPSALDQDDACIWPDRDDGGRSVIIAADKDANAIFVYELGGDLIQKVEITHPGNIDLRTDVVLNGKPITLVAVTERDAQRLAVFGFDASTRTLSRLDDGEILTGENYGGTLCWNSQDRRSEFLATSKTQGISRWELHEVGNGRVGARLLGRWPLAMCEGAVADDRDHCFYIGVESEGIYRLPFAATPQEKPTLVIAARDAGFTGDVEGLTLLRSAAGTTYLIASDQAGNRFLIFRPTAEGHYPLAAIFAVAGVSETDGVDLTQAALGTQFPAGLLVCHSHQENGRIMRGVDLRDILPLVP